MQYCNISACATSTKSILQYSEGTFFCASYFFCHLFGTFEKSSYLCIDKVCFFMSKKEKEEKAKEFWEYYEATQGTITITDPEVLD